MPIKIEDFNKARKTSEIIISFLYKNKDEAYTMNEIMEQAGFREAGIANILVNLKLLVIDGFVDRGTIKGKDYYAISNKSIKIIKSK